MHILGLGFLVSKYEHDFNLDFSIILVHVTKSYTWLNERHVVLLGSTMTSVVSTRSNGVSSGSSSLGLSSDDEEVSARSNLTFFLAYQ